jgi:hypothetical protein
MSPRKPTDDEDYADHEATLGSVAAAHLKPDHIGDALVGYAQHVHEKTGGDGAKMATLISPEHAGKFFAKHAKKNPDQALPPDPPPSKADLRKRGISW